MTHFAQKKKVINEVIYIIVPMMIFIYIYIYLKGGEGGWWLEILLFISKIQLKDLSVHSFGSAI